MSVEKEEGEEKRGKRKIFHFQVMSDSYVETKKFVSQKWRQQRLPEPGEAGEQTVGQG